MSIPQGLLQAIPQNPLEGAIAVCRYAIAAADEAPEWNEDAHRILLEASAVILSLDEQEMISVLSTPPVLEGHMGTICNNMQKFLQNAITELIGQSTAKKLDALKAGFSITLANGFGYEFTEGDISRVQTLVNELRDILTNCEDLDDGHKRRLMKRLEALQGELHKKVSDITQFYSLMGDAGVALGKLGKDAKPIVDRIKEIINIGWQSQARAEQLPSDSQNPMITHENEPPALS